MRSIHLSSLSTASASFAPPTLTGFTVVVAASELGVRSIEFARLGRRPLSHRAVTSRTAARRVDGPAHGHLEHALEELKAYFDGNPTEFSVSLDLEDQGTPFQRRVWRILQCIPRGVVWSYAEVAARAGVPQGARAVGGAVGRNPIPVMIPCHRVVGTSGRLTGFSSGLDLKVRLLELEGSVLSRAASAADAKVLS